VALEIPALLLIGFFAAVAGVGLTLFQDLIPRPGLASGLYVNTRRVGAIIAGPIISLGSATTLGYGGVFLACAIITTAALVTLGATNRKPIEGDSCPSSSPRYSTRSRDVRQS
jgi:hypothetical protein